MSLLNWNFFRTALLEWYRPGRRPMPWKEISDPYRIWLSEIILQQTRVEQGLPYYERFVAAFPKVNDLAAAPEDQVMKLWEGLGYYSRARNLMKAARMVVELHGGSFPDTYAGLRTLPGVGPYTAAAIASFAFDRQTPVLDGNVFRVLSRFANDATPVDTTPGKKHYQATVERALGEASARRFNQAIMDFGAMVCTPKAADCGKCPLAAECRAKAAGTVYERPIKEKKLKRRTRYFHYLVISDEAENYLLQKREEKDIWQGLYQFPLVEADRLDLSLEELRDHPDWPPEIAAGKLEFLRKSQAYRHQLTHQTIGIFFYRFRAESLPEGKNRYQKINHKKFKEIGFPRPITRFLADKSLILDLF